MNSNVIAFIFLSILLILYLFSIPFGYPWRSELSAVLDRIIIWSLLSLG